MLRAIKLIGFFIINNNYIKQPNLRIMPYVTTGAVHHSGVGNEKQLVNLGNSNQDLNINKHFKSCAKDTSFAQWTQLGGTTQKADCKVCISELHQYLISIKNHESTGTFDWINTSKLADINPKLADVIKPKIAEFKAKYNGQSVTKEMRQEMEEIFSNSFEYLSSDEIKALLVNLYDKYPEFILINDRSNNKLFMYNKLNNFKEFTHYQDWTYKFKTARGKTSRMLFREKDGIEVNTNLRVRLVLNNGVNALVGQSNSNKTSVPCLKIQQDRVNLLMDGIENPIVDILPDITSEECTTLNSIAIPDNLQLLADVASQQEKI